MTTARAVVIGIGNSYRCDDGIGPALVTAIESVCPAGVTLTVSDGEPSQLLAAWSGVQLAVLVDAVLCDAPVPGRIHRSVLATATADPPAASTRTGAASTHGLGIPDAIPGLPERWTEHLSGLSSWPWKPPASTSELTCRRQSPPACLL